jgi:hypothetical protein
MALDGKEKDMTTRSTKTATPEGQREALADSERKASEHQPGSFKEEANEEKVVAIPPVGKDSKPIRGLDPK